MGSSKDAATIGYLTTLEDERAGWTGGLLVLNAGGRPLEFQCTLPIRPTRAHEILFGNSLRPHLIAEVIGATLLAKCRTPISILCCEQVEALALQETAPADCSVALVATAAEADEGPIEDSMLDGHCRVMFGDVPLLVAMERSEHVAAMVGNLAELPDVLEPFERIREAIREAQSQIALAARNQSRQSSTMVTREAA